MSTPASDMPQTYPQVLLPSLGGYIPAPDALPGVTFWPRVGARLIDTVVYYMVAYLSGRLFGTMLALASGGHVPPLVIWKLRHTGITGFAFGALAALAYYVIFDVVHGSTIGKRMLSMVVVQEDGSPCRLKGALIRELGYYVDALFFGMIGHMAMQGTDQQQRYGDQWAHTVVCKRSAIAEEKLNGGGRFAVALVFALAADAAVLMTGLLVAMLS